MSSPLAGAFGGETDTEASQDPVLTLTPVARERIIELRDAEPEGKQLGLRLEILGEEAGEFRYDLSFDELVKAALSDMVDNHDGLRTIVPSKDAPNLQGSVLDFEDGGLVLRNPNRPRSVQLGSLTVNDELSDRVRAVIDTEVNPALDAHGGFVTYVGHDGDKRAYLTMGGGCHGCSMSRMTMLQGVQSTILAAIPELERVVDATDHSTGENPFYQ